MKKSVIPFFLLGIVLLWAKEGADFLYPIPTLTVESGKVNGFDLSVYRKEVKTKITVGEHPDLKIRYMTEVDSLFIIPRVSATRLILLPIWIGGEEFDLLIHIKHLVAYTFTYRPNPGDTQVVVMGGFNDWSRTAFPLQDEDGDGIFERTVYLKPQRHEYKFVVDGKELIDPNNPNFVSNNLGGWNSVLDLSSYKKPSAGQFIKDTWAGNTVIFHYLPPLDGSVPMKLFVLFNNRQLDSHRWSLQSDGRLSVNIEELTDGVLKITGLDEQDRVIPENHTLLKTGQPIHPKDQTDDWHFAILYSLMIDRFLDGNPTNTKRSPDPDLYPLANFYGGDFVGIIQKLEEGYFDKLGVSAIWLSPVQRQPDDPYVEWIPPNRKFTGYHGYWPIEPRTIDPRFGTEDELKTLVTIAHERSKKIILDFVSNHVHEEHPYYHNHKDWFGHVENPDGTMNIRNWSEETRLTTWFDIFLPSYDFVHSEEAIDQVVNDALWWLSTYHFDGFRQDAVKHLPHKFWRTLTLRMKQRFPDQPTYQIGETYGSDELILSYVNPGELDAQFNFEIYFNARVPFSSDQPDFTYLGRVIKENLTTYGPIHLMGNITSSHDQVRFIAFADHQLSFNDNGSERAYHQPPNSVQNLTSYQKLTNFYAFNCVLPGIPILYYGEEIGLMGAGDPDNRRPMKFGKNLSNPEKETFQNISLINHLRSQYPSLSIGDLLLLTAKGSTMAILKVYFDEAILFVLNNGPKPIHLELHIPLQGNVLTNLFSQKTIQVENQQVTLPLQPYSHYFYQLQ